jgi:hypothetical protein
VTAFIPRSLFALLCLSLLAPLLAAPAAAPDPAIAGRWRLDPAQSSALDGWSAMDLVIALDGSRVSLGYDMTWRTTQVQETDVVDTARPVEILSFFRVQQRHMAVYPSRTRPARATAAWLDSGRTLRVEAEVPVEISQGGAVMRLYDEYRVLPGGDTLVWIELHSTRPKPLVYVFHRVPAEAAKN